jgi:hypothetical protein
VKIDGSQLYAQGGVKMKAGAGSFVNSLKEGDSVRAEVMSRDGNTVTMKTDGGQVFKAKMDADVALMQGDKVLLEVVGKDAGSVVLSIAKEDQSADGKAAQSDAAKGFADKSLEPYAAKLAELRMPVSEGTAVAMRELVANNPGMTLDEAAFIASNKLAGDAAMIKSALAVLSGDGKTDAMIGKLITLLADASGAGEGASRIQSAVLVSAAARTVGVFPDSIVSQERSAPLTDWLTTVGNAASGGSEATLGGGLTEAQTILRGIIPQTDTILQTRIAINGEENSQNFDFKANLSVFEGQNQVLGAPNTAAAGQNVFGVPQFAQTAPGMPAAAAEQGTQATPAQLAGKAIADALAGLPQFRSTPPPALEHFSNMLYRVAAESADISGGDTAKLAALLDKLFTKIEKSDGNDGERLRASKEELFARLTMLEEAISRAAPKARAEMLEQTQKLIDHVRLLNSIEQFVYMQLPVSTASGNKSAEVYIFKRKGGKGRIDPDNVNILLAIDLEHMGHWEGLVNIRKKDVSIRMQVPGEEQKAFFSANTVMLHELLSEAGFKLTGTDINCATDETTLVTALTALDRYTPRRGIDFMI